MRAEVKRWNRSVMQEVIGIGVAVAAIVAALLLSSCGGGGGGGGGGDAGGNTVLDLTGGTQSVQGALAASGTKDFTVKNAGIDITMMLFGLIDTAKLDVFSDSGFSVPLACASGQPDPGSVDHLFGYPADCNLGMQTEDIYVRLTAEGETPYVFTVAIPGAAVGTTCFGETCAHQGSIGAPAALELEPGNDVVVSVGKASVGDGGSVFHISGLAPDTYYALATGGIAVGTETVGFGYYASSNFAGPPSDCNLTKNAGGSGQPMSCFPSTNGDGEMWLFVGGTSDAAEGTQLVLFLAGKDDSIEFPY